MHRKLFKRKGTNSMKRSILIMMFIIVTLALTSMAFAEAALNGPLPNGNPAITTVIGGAAFIPSTNVYFHICSADGSGSPPNVYEAMDQNAGAANNVAGRQFGATNTTAIQFATAASTSTGFTSCDTTGVLPAATSSTPSAPTPNWTNL